MHYTDFRLSSSGGPGERVPTRKVPYRHKLVVFESWLLWVKCSIWCDTRWYFPHLFEVKLYWCLKRPKINYKEAEDGPFWNIFYKSENKTNIVGNRQWLWLSWKRGCFWYQRYAVQIQSLAKIYLYWTFVYCQLCIEKTKIKKKRPGMAHI